MARVATAQCIPGKAGFIMQSAMNAGRLDAVQPGRSEDGIGTSRDGERR